MSFAIKKTHQYLGCILGCVVLPQFGWAALQTTPYIAVHSQPQYVGRSAMPYANPQAPKGGDLIRASNGTFDNLNDMNGKGSSTDGVSFKWYDWQGQLPRWGRFYIRFTHEQFFR